MFAKRTRNFFSVLLMCLMVFHPGVTFAEIKKTEPNGCFMLSIPKSGTHLLKKLIMMMSDLKPNRLVHLHARVQELSPQEFEREVLKCVRNHQMIVSHTNPILFNDHFLHFSDRHPNFAKLIQIRNLGDAIVSLIKFRLGPIKSEIGGNPTFDDVLTHFLERKNGVLSQSFAGMVEGALLWLNRSDAVILKFEDLVGVSGGGTLASQKRAIKAVATALNVRLTKNQLDDIAHSLFGNEVGPVSPTFRQGQIGGWRQHFKPHHVKLFNEHWGYYQTALGYSLLEERDLAINKENY